MRRILFIQIFLIFIILFIGIISFLKFQDDRIIFERIIAQEDISTINNNSLLLLQNDKDMLIVYAPVKFKSTTWGVLFISPLSNNNNNNNKSIT